MQAEIIARTGLARWRIKEQLRRAKKLISELCTDGPPTSHEKKVNNFDHSVALVR